MSKLKVIDVCIDSDNNQYNDDELLESSTVSVNFSDGNCVCVQMTGGECREDMGCIVCSNCCLDDDDIEESMRDEAIEAAEKFIKEEINKTFDVELINFVYLENDVSLFIRENKYTKECEIIKKQDYHQDYIARVELIKKFDSKHDALSFLEDNSDENDILDL